MHHLNKQTITYTYAYIHTYIHPSTLISIQIFTLLVHVNVVKFLLSEFFKLYLCHSFICTIMYQNNKEVYMKFV